VSVNQTWATISGDFLIAALLIYSLALLAFAGDFAFGRPRRAATNRVVKERVAELATVGGGASDGASSVGPDSDAARPAAVLTDSMPAARLSAWQSVSDAGNWVRNAIGLSILGVAAHVIAVVARGLAVHRAPWGNMYEFITALTCIAALFFVYVMIRYRAWALGVFVMGAIVLALGLAETLIYTAAGPLVPALQSYWLSIHVTAMTLSTGIFFVAAVLGILYLVAQRYRKRIAAGNADPNELIARIPSPEQLDKLTYRAVIFGFPIWTFGVIAGAIWADQAWGRYWGWDPVETWAFVTWVLYACYLHARATAGWRGTRSHIIQLLGFASLMTNMLVVQVFLNGMHSYAGVG
jgi:cytochrome c-type biogenesis protein CcsB